MTKPVTYNQHPEQQARDIIDQKLEQAGWTIQSVKHFNPNSSLGVAVREYPTDSGPVDYLLFVDREPVAIIEAKEENFGHKLNTVEEQSARYADSELKHIPQADIAFLYESTGVITRFTNRNDPAPRAREVFHFHRPETLQKWANEGKNTLRAKLKAMPQLNPNHLSAAELGLRDCQLTAIENMQDSLAKDLPRALIQMATGAGKTYTAISIMYRLLKYTGKRRILFLVDTVNLGEQAEQEMLVFTPSDDNRKFTELYNAQVIKLPHIPKGVEVCICTIQRMYSLLKGEELSIPDDSMELEEWENRLKEPLPVAYQPDLPPEFFDFIFIDECHRSIYNLWRQVLDYFDAYLIGLTATPDNRTFGFFNQNVVSEYSHEQAVADGVNVGNEVYLINTKISLDGGKFKAEELIEHRERTTRRKRWQQQDSDEDYTAKQLDRDVVNPSQIRTIIRTFRDHLPVMFPNRQEVPKTLIFAKNDSHADDIIKMVREEFGQGNEFCKKITYKAKDDIVGENGEVIEQGEEPKTVLANFRNDYNPRIAVTVDMIATGTDVRPLECLLFMRDVKSRNYFEQMKGRGTRTLSKDELQKVTPSATENKDHFVIVDAVGVTKSRKSDTRPLESKPSVSMKELMMNVALGAKDEKILTSLANRVIRLNSQMTPAERKQFEEKVGTPAGTVAERLLNAFDEDVIEKRAQFKTSVEEPDEEERKEAQKELIKQAVAPFHNPDVREYIENVRRNHDQIIDNVNIDSVIFAGFDTQQEETAERVIKTFHEFIEENKDEIVALRIIYDETYKNRPMAIEQLKALYEKLKSKGITVERLWDCYAIKKSDKVKRGTIAQLTDLISIIRFEMGYIDNLTPFADKVNYNFMQWTLRRNAGAIHFTEEQMEWLRLIKDHIATSLSILPEDLDLTPFDRKGGLLGFYDAFGDSYEEILQEMNEELVA